MFDAVLSTLKPDGLRVRTLASGVALAAMGGGGGWQAPSSSFCSLPSLLQSGLTHQGRRCGVEGQD